MGWAMMHRGEYGERGGKNSQSRGVLADGGGGGEGEGGGEEGLELVLPQGDGKPAGQGVEQTGLALHLYNCENCETP